MDATSVEVERDHNHLTPEDLAAKAGMPVEEVYRICREEHIVGLNGKIDKWLFGKQCEALGIEHQLVLQ